MITIVDDDRQWFKSSFGINVRETPRDLAFCSYAILDAENLLVVPDASTDDRFSDNPLVAGNPSIRFYAGAPLVTNNGNALGTLCVIDREPRTLTEEQERSLRALSTQVMALLELRRTVQRLKEKQREVEEATRQRDSFMATVSHEIRTPLTAVVGYIEMLREGVPEDTRAELIETVAEQAADVEHLLEDFLVSARAEADSLQVAEVRVQLAAQVAQVVEGLALAGRSGLSIETEPCSALGDPARVRQIIRNLVTNAIRYGGPNITIRTETKGTDCHLLVIDDGPGIPPDERDIVFQPFQQSTGVRPASDSVGLGLSISRLLAAKMGGTLSYRYEDGHSVFDLALRPVID